jgi:hypothetical protein
VSDLASLKIEIERALLTDSGDAAVVAVCTACAKALPGDGVDLVVVARPEAARAGFGALTEDLVKLLSAVRPAPWEDAGRVPG